MRDAPPAAGICRLPASPLRSQVAVEATARCRLAEQAPSAALPCAWLKADRIGTAGRGRPFRRCSLAGSLWCDPGCSVVQPLSRGETCVDNWRKQAAARPAAPLQGGSDILMGMHKDGSLEKMLKP